MSGAERPTRRAPQRHAQRRGDVAIIVVFFALLFGYDTLEGITNLQQLPTIYATLGIAEATPWAILIASVALPPVLFALSMALGRGRGIVARAGILLVGLGVSGATALLLEELARMVAGAALAG